MPCSQSVVGSAAAERAAVVLAAVAKV